MDNQSKKKDILIERLHLWLPSIPESVFEEQKAPLVTPKHIYSYPSGFRVGVESRATGLYDSVHEDCELDEDNTPDNLRGTSIEFDKRSGHSVDVQPKFKQGCCCIV